MNYLTLASVFGGLSSIFGAIGTIRRKEWLKSLPYIAGILTFVLFLINRHRDKEA